MSEQLKEIFPSYSVHGIVHRNTKTIFRYNGWPSITKDDRGVLYATASSMRVQHVDPLGKNCMFVSFNEGETWTPPIVVNDDFLDDRDSGIVYLGGGKMCMSYFNQVDEDHYARFADYEWLKDQLKETILSMGRVQAMLTPEQADEGAFVKLSDDYGVTWSESIHVPMSAPHGPNVTKDGGLIYLGRILPGNCGENEKRIALFYSGDCGKTWEMRGIVPQPDYLVSDHLHEPHVVELPSGRLLGAIRVHCRPDPYEPKDTVYTTFSDDGGRTWSMPECIGVSGLPPHLLVHSSGAVICSYARRGGPGNSSQRAAVSYDGGETWAEDYVIDDTGAHWDLGYPATVELSDGSLLSVYYQCLNDTDDFCSILSTKWRLEK